jgi:hypothetical protein
MRDCCRHVSRSQILYGKANLSLELSKYNCVKLQLCLTLYTASFRELQDEGAQTADSSYNEQETQCTVSKSVEVTELNLPSWV